MTQNNAKRKIWTKKRKILAKKRKISEILVSNRSLKTQNGFTNGISITKCLLFHLEFQAQSIEGQVPKIQKMN